MPCIEPLYAGRLRHRRGDAGCATATQLPACLLRNMRGYRRLAGSMLPVLPPGGRVALRWMARRLSQPTQSADSVSRPSQPSQSVL